MSEISYCLADPTGNITLLIDGEYDAKLRHDIALELMKREPTAEQAGFVYECGDADTALCMYGGEFCGNAAMSVAALWCREKGIESASVAVRVSGAEKAVPVTVRRDGEIFRCRVEMPEVLSFEQVCIELDGEALSLPLVRMQGICHAVSETEIEREKAEKLVRKLCTALHAEAAGLMLLDREAGRIRPLVYVAGVDAMFWESSCASGTSAVGAYLAHESGMHIAESFSEPAGCMSVEAEPDGRIVLGGTVRLSEQKYFALM